MTLLGTIALSRGEKVKMRDSRNLSLDEQLRAAVQRAMSTLNPDPQAAAEVQEILDRRAAASREITLKRIRRIKTAA